MKDPYFTLDCGCNERNDSSRGSNVIPSAVRNPDLLLAVLNGVLSNKLLRGHAQANLGCAEVDRERKLFGARGYQIDQLQRELQESVNCRILAWARGGFGQVFFFHQEMRQSTSNFIGVSLERQIEKIREEKNAGIHPEIDSQIPW